MTTTTAIPKGRLVAADPPVVHPTEPMKDNYRVCIGHHRHHHRQYRRRRHRSHLHHSLALRCAPIQLQGVQFKWAVPEDRHHRRLAVIDSVDLPYTGSKKDFDLELNVSVCKLYMETFDKLRLASSGVQGLKNRWFIKTGE